MRRREFITLIGGAAATWPIAARAQQPERMRRIGVILNAAETDTLARSNVKAFVGALRNLGWSEGQNLQVDIRWNDGSAELAQTRAAELVALAPDAILSSSTINLSALQRLSPTAPIVFLGVTDPLAQGFVSNLARPGGNITGFTYFEVQTAGKLLDLLKQIVPGVTRVSVIFNPDTSPPSQIFSNAIKGAAPSFGVEVVARPVHVTADIEPVIDNFSRQPNGALIFPPDQFIAVHRKLILELAALYRLPAIYSRPGIAEEGGLMSYYAVEIEQFRQAASYVDRILRGAKPGDLPIQQPTKFKLVINLKTANALGLTVSPNFLATVDEVIE
jgi:putative ABC transport system substrate-binding protein